MDRLSFAATTVLGCLLVSGCGKSSTVVNIERVLKEDARTNSGAKSVADVVTRMRAINLDGCPQDFSLAYIAHIHAWESASDVEQEAKTFNENFNSDGALLEAFLRGMSFDFNMPREARVAQDRLRVNYQHTSGRIRDTFHRVEEIAIKHGASLPRKKQLPTRGQRLGQQTMLGAVLPPPGSAPADRIASARRSDDALLLSQACLAQETSVIQPRFLCGIHLVKHRARRRPGITAPLGALSGGA